MPGGGGGGGTLAANAGSPFDAHGIDFSDALSPANAGMRSFGIGGRAAVRGGSGVFPPSAICAFSSNLNILPVGDRVRLREIADRPPRARTRCILRWLVRGVPRTRAALLSAIRSWNTARVRSRPTRRHPGSSTCRSRFARSQSLL